jgi:hypothetical protein
VKWKFEAAVLAALFCVLAWAGLSGAFELGALRDPQTVLNATHDSVMVYVSTDRPDSLPSGLLAFTGDNTEFHVKAWLGSGSGKLQGAWSSWMGVPGTLTLPVFGVPQRRDIGGTMYYVVGWKIYSATDSVTCILIDE